MDIEHAASALGALAHTHRLTMFRLLVTTGPEGLSAGRISQTVGISATAASFHLKELDRAGLIFGTRDGRHIRYAAHIQGIRQLLAYLTEDCCQGQPEMCGVAFAGKALGCPEGTAE